ncbi:hypothetical protein [Nonomuraea sp. NPDC003709]|uniref:hypothetical protein n=1 Tax=Nonomuraea sp. NPDC003709 TaxID=3154450 RepID=UPI0033ABEBF3
MRLPVVLTLAAVLSCPACSSGAGPGDCPVTLPSPAPTSSNGTPGPFFGRESSHGAGSLWVGGLEPDGVIEAGADFVRPDGSISMKYGWWRGVAGKLEISGRRLDGPAAPLRSDVPDGYGDTGFQATGVYFPVEGCWEVTGRVGSARLTFVTLVTRAGATSQAR